MVVATPGPQIPVFDLTTGERRAEYSPKDEPESDDPA